MNNSNYPSFLKEYSLAEQDKVFSDNCSKEISWLIGIKVNQAILNLDCY